MSDTKGKVNLLDTVPVQCGHITTGWEGEYAVLSFPRFKYDWMRRFLLPKSMSADIRVKLEEHCTAVWSLIDGKRTVQEIISLLTEHFQNEFVGKKTLENGAITLGVVKNGKVEKPDYQVDGISGGTITSVGVDAMLKSCLNSYLSFLTK